MHHLSYPTSLSRPSVDIRSAPSEPRAACSPTVIRYPVTRVRSYSLEAHHTCRVTIFPDFLATESRSSFPVSCRWRHSCIGQPYRSDSWTSATSDFSETAPVGESCLAENAQSPSGYSSGNRESVQAGDNAASSSLDDHLDGNKKRNDDRWLGLFRSSDLQPLAAGLLLMAAFALSVPRRALALDGSPPTVPPPASSATMPVTFESVQKSPPASASAVAKKAIEVIEESEEKSTKPDEAARIGLDASAQLLEWERTAGSADVATLKTELKNQLLTGSFHQSLFTLERLIELEPSQEEWVIIAAQTLLALGETQRAKNIYNEILQINPFSPRALQGLTAIMQSVGEDSLVLGLIEGKVQQALEAGLQPEVINLKLLLGQVHTLQGNVKAALAEYEQVSKEAPNDFRPYLCQGLVYILMGDKEKADASFVEFQQRCPKDFPLRSTVDDILLESQLATRRMGAQNRQGGNTYASKKASPSLSQPTFPTSNGGEEKSVKE